MIETAEQAKQHFLDWIAENCDVIGPQGGYYLLPVGTTLYLIMENGQIKRYEGEVLCEPEEVRDSA